MIQNRINVQNRYIKWPKCQNVVFIDRSKEYCSTEGNEPLHTQCRVWAMYIIEELLWMQCAKLAVDI